MMLVISWWYLWWWWWWWWWANVYDSNYMTRSVKLCSVWENDSWQQQRIVRGEESGLYVFILHGTVLAWHPHLESWLAIPAITKYGFLTVSACSICQALGPFNWITKKVKHITAKSGSGQWLWLSWSSQWGREKSWCSPSQGLSQHSNTKLSQLKATTLITIIHLRSSLC